MRGDLLLLNPPLWHQPLAGFDDFLDLNAHRAAHAELNVATCFFGRLYDARHPLPWYNTLFWTGVTVPVGSWWPASASCAPAPPAGGPCGPVADRPVARAVGGPAHCRSRFPTTPSG